MRRVAVRAVVTNARSWRSSSGRLLGSQFQDAADQAARAEAVRLGPGSPSRSPVSSHLVLGRLDLMFARAMSRSVRSASKEAADPGTPQDRDLHPIGVSI